MENKGTVVLIAFYNTKALGVRYLETALRKSGYEVATIFFKNFNSVHPETATKQELDLLRSRIEEVNPVLIGLSVMSSMYLDTVHQVLDALGSYPSPLACGGAFATMFPEHFLTRGVEFVIRADGETAICRLADAIVSGSDYRKIPSLCYKAGEENVINDIGDICSEIDDYGQPTINSKNACYIENDKILNGDPQLSTLSYEVVASRGCPFSCSYCCCINLRRLFPKGIKAVRTRSVQMVMEELEIAKKECKKLVFIHFYDEVFPNLPGWVDEFVVEYKKRIGLPFTIWSHPKMNDTETLKKLVSAGLTEVIMGIQSGSERVRREVFHRYETQEDIINSTRAIHRAGVFWASYDFMLQHPFETIEDLKETYKLVKKLCPPFELQLHGLNFLPGTDIVPMAIAQGYLTEQEMEEIMYAPMDAQFGAYWQRENELESRLWYRLTYCLQFKGLRKRAERYEEDIFKYQKQIDRDYALGQKLFRARYYYKKGVVVLRRVGGARFRPR